MSFRRPAGSFRLWGEEEKENGGRHSPFLLSRRRPSAEKSLRLGAKGTEEQGFAGIRAPSPCRPGAEKVRRLGAKGTKEQGFAGIRAPSPRRPGAEKVRRLGAKERKNKALRGFVHQVRAGRAPKRSGDLVQRNGRTRLCGNSCTKSVPTGRRHLPPIRPVSGGTSKKQ